MASWSRVPLRSISAALEELELRRFRDEDGRLLVDLPRLPLPAEHRPKLFNTKAPQSVNTFLVDGVVAGSWRYDGGRIKLEPFGRLSPEPRPPPSRSG